MFSKRIKDLQIGDEFYFSAVWRKVKKKDAKFLYYYTEQKRDKYKPFFVNEDTIMVNSQMIVETKNEE